MVRQIDVWLAADSNGNEFVYTKYPPKFAGFGIWQVGSGRKAKKEGKKGYVLVKEYGGVRVIPRGTIERVTGEASSYLSGPVRLNEQTLNNLIMEL